MTAIENGCPLTRPEMAAIELLAEGLTYQQIGQRLGKASSTVRTQLHTSYTKLDVHGAPQAIVECVRRGWLTIDAGDFTAAPSGEDIRALIAIMERLEERLRRGKHLTRPQRAIVDALDDHLDAVTDEEKVASRTHMTEALTVVLSEAGVPIRERRHPIDIVEVLCDYVLVERQSQRRGRV